MFISILLFVGGLAILLYGFYNVLYVPQPEIIVSISSVATGLAIISIAAFRITQWRKEKEEVIEKDIEEE